MVGPRVRAVTALADVDEAWAWPPSMERATDWFGLGVQAANVYASS